MRRMDIIFDIDIDQNPSCQSKPVGKKQIIFMIGFMDQLFRFNYSLLRPLLPLSNFHLYFLGSSHKLRFLGLRVNF